MVSSSPILLRGFANNRRGANAATPRGSVGAGSSKGKRRIAASAATSRAPRSARAYPAIRVALRIASCSVIVNERAAPSRTSNRMRTLGTPAG